MRHEQYIRLALKLASRNIKYQHNIGAVIVRGGSIISTGVNLYENGLHAEMRAIFSSKNDLAGSIIYIARYMRSMSWGLSKPCPDCQKIICENGIRMAVYTNNNNSFDIWKP